MEMHRKECIGKQKFAELTPVRLWMPGPLRPPLLMVAQRDADRATIIGQGQR
jgi:hypothetical protein